MNKETSLPRLHKAFQIVNDLMEDGDMYHRLCGGDCDGDVFMFDGKNFQCQKCGEKFIPDPNELEDWAYQYVT
jgi:hypothetical protein